MTITAQIGSTGTVLALEGSFDLDGAERLHDALRQIDAGRSITVDFHEVRLFHDLAVARLARELNDLNDAGGRRLTLLGLSEHHHRLLRYVGV